MRPGLPAGGGVSTSPSEVERAPRGLGQFGCCSGDWRIARPMALAQALKGPPSRWHGCPYNQPTELDLQN